LCHESRDKATSAAGFGVFSASTAIIADSEHCFIGSGGFEAYADGALPIAIEGVLHRVRNGFIDDQSHRHGLIH
jgi:hypothetical protein